ncbi:hypothetical protein GCM10022225_82070 [Plantactinospora mayteni]|uniref:Uncharacterized protein n=1 Tax=Plantactinospora mayteni TaxID=566021 RepID=A0ABQ4F3Y0_9ACTN|nr:Imm1 family immunity protein [Plantactinospora mayteni]GIH01614.1 hypothetical protein Pma05_81860 [Plantactinospora mayteni]
MDHPLQDSERVRLLGLGHAGQHPDRILTSTDQTATVAFSRLRWPRGVSRVGRTFPTAASAGLVTYAVQIHQPGRHGAIMIGIGHPERSFVDWLDRSQPHGSGNRYATDPDLPPASEAIAFDFYGDWTEMPPERTRITPERAREAAREYLRTGQQPSLAWVAG